MSQEGGAYHAYQKVLLRYAPKTRKSLLIYHGTGTGKTVSGFAIAVVILRTERFGTVYVFAPNKVVETAWRGELRKRAANPGPRDDETTRDFAYLSEQAAAGRIRFLAHEAMPITGVGPVGPDDTVIIDEAHEFRYSGGKVSQKTKSAIRIAAVAKHRFLLTATPVWNTPGEASSLYMMLLDGEEDRRREDRLREVLTAYANCFDKAAKEKDKQSIANWWRCLVSAYKKPEHDPNFPKRIREKVLGFMEEKEYKDVYLPAEKMSIDKAKHDAFWTNLRIANNVESKLAWFLEYLRSVGILREDGKFDPTSSHKVVVYSHWRSVIKRVAAKLKSLKVPTSRITGDTSPDDARSFCERYNLDDPRKRKRYPVIFLSDAASVGIELKHTGTLVIWEPQWNVEATNQVMGRVARHKSHDAGREVIIKELVWGRPPMLDSAGPTADQHLVEIGRKKEPLVNTFYEALFEASVEIVTNRCGDVSVGHTFPVWRPTRETRSPTTSERNPPHRPSPSGPSVDEEPRPLLSVKLKEIPPGTYESSNTDVRPDGPPMVSVPAATSLRPGVVGKIPRGYVMPWERRRPTVSLRDFLPILFI